MGFNTRYIPEFKWYLFVEQSEKKAVKAILRALSISLSICIVITILVFVLVYRTISSYQNDLETLATTDKLTGMSNRRAFDTIIEQTIKEVNRNKEPLSLIIFDIDNFKDTNDVFGHIAGDSVLKNVAKTARGNIRIPDALFRWGGEEFLIILKECGLDYAFDVAEKIRKAVANSPTLHKDKKIPTTISLGVTQYLQEESVDAMLSRVDKALYTAKHNGRDRTEKAL